MQPSLIQHQSQRLVLSPQIRQYLRLLQLPMTELQQAVEIELSQNPVLEESAKQNLEDSGEAVDDNTLQSDKSSEELRLGETFDNLAKLDDNFRENYHQDISYQERGESQRTKDYQENTLTQSDNLSDFLKNQIRFLDLSDSQQTIAQEIIGNLDDNGYLRATTHEIAAACSMSEASVEQVLLVIQTLDPPGIAARDLKETLKIQLIKKGDQDSLAYRITDECLTLLEKRDWKQIAKKLGATNDQVLEAAEMIKLLDPHPGRSYQAEDSLVITPDAAITFSDNESGRLKVDIHDELIPELKINRYYRKLLRMKQTDNQTKEFLREKIQAAINFIRAVNLRKSTLREITEEIIKQQPHFFEKGFAHLKPMRLKDIAEKIGIHESTVSRALQGKYISTPQGVIPYKSFFSSRLETTHGEAESQKSIMEKIKHLVEREDPSKPVSDQAIVNQLKADGILIARRTVAKYRDLLKILPSHLRRKR